MRKRPKIKSHWFQILLALADRERHGLEIMKEVLECTEGQMHLWPGMLYNSLRQLEEKGYVAETKAPPGAASGGGRPRYYRITASGREALSEELRLLSRYLDAARRKDLLDSTRPS